MSDSDMDQTHPFISLDSFETTPSRKLSLPLK
jgi:hypothetical protein